MCKICARESFGDLCIWCEIFGKMNIHGAYTFPDGKLSISSSPQSLPSHLKEQKEIKELNDFNNQEKPRRD